LLHDTGNFSDSAAFWENLSRKPLLIRSFAGAFPTRPSREFFRTSRELVPPFRPDQGIWREIDRAPERGSPCASWAVDMQAARNVDSLGRSFDRPARNRSGRAKRREALSPRSPCVNSATAGGRVQHDRAIAEPAYAPDEAAGDFAAIGDQNIGGHGGSLAAGQGREEARFTALPVIARRARSARGASS
jgi:hypothetical protein